MVAVRDRRAQSHAKLLSMRRMIAVRDRAKCLYAVSTCCMGPSLRRKWTTKSWVKAPGKMMLGDRVNIAVRDRCVRQSARNRCFEPFLILFIFCLRFATRAHLMHVNVRIFATL